VVALSGVVIGTIVIGLLYWAQAILIPIALAVFLTFVLTPFVLALQRRGLGRVPSVLLVVLSAALLTFGTVWLVSYELTGLAGKLPDYTSNIKTKIKSFREAAEGSIFDRLKRMTHEIGLELQTTPGEEENGQPQPGDTGSAAASPPAAVVVQPPAVPWVSRLQGLLGSAVEVIGQLALVGVLVVFMMFSRKDLRDRLIRVVAHGRITVATKALDEAALRISRFLLMQAIINGSFGLALSVGLFLIGIPYALLWGFLAALLRYVPFIGIWFAAVLPVGLSIALFETWWQPLAVIALLIVLEVVASNFMEPWLFGKSIGVSEVAFLIAAGFWTFLWGPVGLVLAAPMTVCLVVLGKFVPHLEFLEVLLGDEPALEPEVRYYQRALARDQDEATEVVMQRLAETSTEQVYDRLLIPALIEARRDREQATITEADERFLLRVTQEVVEDLGEQALRQGAGDVEASNPSDPSGAEPAAPRVLVLGYPTRDEAEEVALNMLRQLLPPARWELELVPSTVLCSELIARIEESNAGVICLASLPPGGLAHTRYLCKRLRSRFPTLRIVAGRWGLEENREQNQASLVEAGADQVGTTLRETRDQLAGWLPVLETRAETPVAGEAGALIPTG
jgi:predicted PurR-regulated permease PerM